MLKNISNKQNYTFLLIVMILFLSIILWFYFSPSKKLELAATEVESIALQIRKNFADKVSYWGLSTQYVIDNNILTNLSYDEKQIVNALGNKVEIGQDETGTTVMPGERTFGIAYTDLTVGECIALAAYRFKRPEELGLLSITIINQDNRHSFDWGEGDYKLPISRQNAKKFCKNHSTILWIME